MKEWGTAHIPIAIYIWSWWWFCS